MAEHVPHYSDGKPVLSPAASATVTAGQVVEVTGNMTVGPAGANSVAVCGVAGNDAASTALVTTYTSGVHDLTAAGAIAAGAQVIAAANGTVATVGAATAEKVIGRALEAIADTAKGRVLLNLA